MQDLPKRDCIICHKPFRPIKINNIICPKVRCKWKRHRQQVDQWARDNYVPIEKELLKCPYCSEVVTKIRFDQKTCGKPKCKGKNDYQMKLRRKASIYDRRYVG